MNVKRILSITAIISIMMVPYLRAGNIENRVEMKTPAGNISIRISDYVDDNQAAPSPVLLAIPENIVRRIRLDLRVLRNTYIQKLYSTRDRKAALSITDEIEDLTELIYKLNYSGNINIKVNNTDDIIIEDIVETPDRYQMSPSKFSSLLSQIESESFSDDKFSILKTVVRENYFTVAQLSQIMKKFSMDDDKVKAVRIIYPHTIDKENGYKLISNVTFSDSKDNLKEIINEND